MAGANFYIQNNVMSTSDNHSRWKFIKDSGGNWTLTMPKSFGSALYVGVFVQDDNGNNIPNLSENLIVTSSDPSIVSVSNLAGHGFQLSSKNVVGTTYLTVTIVGTPDSVNPDGMTEVIRITTTNLAVSDYQNMSPILDHFVGSNANVEGYRAMASDLDISAGAEVQITGEKYIEVHDGDVLVSAGSNVDIILKFDVSVESGSNIYVDGEKYIEIKSGDINLTVGTQVNVLQLFDILVESGAIVDVAGRLGASSLILSTQEIKPRYFKEESSGEYNMLILMSQHEVDVNTKAKQGEPDVGLGSVNTDNPEIAIAEKTSDNSFVVKPLHLGEAQIEIVGNGDEATTYLNLTVLDEYPDCILVKNGSQVLIDDGQIVIFKKSMLNNNVNNVALNGAVIMGNEDITISTEIDMFVSKDFKVSASNPPNITMNGFKVLSSRQKVDNGNNLSVGGLVVFSGDLELTHAGSVHFDPKNVINVSGGSQPSLIGWKKEKQHITILSGASSDIAVEGIVISVGEISIDPVSSFNVSGQKAEDISIDHKTVTAVFRGIQVEKETIFINNSATIVLTGVAIGGNLPDVANSSIILYGSIVPGREFIKNQIAEIPEISLDSYTRLGVKLYSYDNTLLNPSQYASAYFTFNDDLQIEAQINSVDSRIDLLVTPAESALLDRKRVYDAKLHVVDENGDHFPILTRKLRFI